MSGSVNKAILIGHLGGDPEVKYTAAGDAVAYFSIATSESWEGKDGTRQEKTEWHRIVAWRRLAELAQQYLAKGRQVYVEGRLQTRQWEDRDGNKRSTTEVVAAQIVFLGSKGEGDREIRPQDESRSQSNGRAPGGASSQSSRSAPAQQAFDDDIPF